MTLYHKVNLCNNGDDVPKEVLRPGFLSSVIQERPGVIDSKHQQEYENAHSQSFAENEIPHGYPIGLRLEGNLYPDGLCHLSTLPTSKPICRQFWKAGEHEAALPHGRTYRDGQNRLRVHPKFLHSNATSHKWAFGAVAELLDNAVDEVQNGASFVVIDKIVNAADGSPALLIQDDGGGMDPESLRCCMSFGFSNKQSDSSIGQYGNGFKTSTMRLGADVIVFSRCRNKRNTTQSVGLLSYTFLRQMGANDVIVPMVDYEADPFTGAFTRTIRHGQRQFHSNLSTLLRWSPFATEAELLKQFNDIGEHGTKVVVFNLWLNDDGYLELDFDTDAEDIMVSGAPKVAKTKSISKMLTRSHVATRFQYSLRVYSSILYLHLPPNFRIILRGQIVERHHIVSDLNFIECIKYKPHISGEIEPIITTVGFLKGAPAITVHGFSIYHKNRLILPFLPVVSTAGGRCRGVAGVLEVNFLKPTHNKQDFERSILYERLEARLKDMAVEYWNYHCHLVGYQGTKTASPAQPNGIQSVTLPLEQFPCSGGQNHRRRLPEDTSSFAMNVSSTGVLNRVLQVPESNVHDSVGGIAVAALCAPSPRQLTNSNNSHIELPTKRRRESYIDATNNFKKPAREGEIVNRLGGNQKNQVECKGKENQVRRLVTMVRANKKLQTQCLELEKSEKQLSTKVQTLRDELQEVQEYHDILVSELRTMDEIKVEK